MSRTEKELAEAASPPTDVPEVVDRAVIDVAGVPIEVQAAVAPTQVRHPWRGTVRTVVQFAIAAATVLPLVVAGVYDDQEQIPVAVGQVLAVIALVTRIMAIPGVEQFLRDWKILQWLSAAPAPDDHVIDPPSPLLMDRVLRLEANRLAGSQRRPAAADNLTPSPPPVDRPPPPPVEPPPAQD